MERRIYLHNVPYDATILELHDFVHKFAPVDKVDVARDKAGLARGFAFVYLQSAQDV